MNAERKQRAMDRGNELVTPLGFELSQIAGLQLDVTKFRNVATAKQWTRNHGLNPDKVTTKVRTIDVTCRAEEDFEPGTLRLERLTKTAKAWVGVLKDSKREDVSEEPEAPAQVELESVPEKVVKIKGDLFRIAKADDDPEDSVRVIGIVAKPEDPDTEGTVISVSEIERANFGFMKDFGTMGFMHQKDVSSKVKIIQNVIAPIDFEYPLPDGSTKSIKAGTWYQELFTDDPDLVERIRGGQITGLSLGGLAQVEDLEDEAA